MKKIIFPLALFQLNCSSLVIHPKVTRFGLNDGKVVLISGQAEEIAKAGFLLELKPGDKLSLAAGISGDFVALEEADLSLSITQPCLLYSRPDGLYLSSNGKEFHTLQDFFRGSVQLQLDMKKNAPVRMNLRLKVSHKSP